MPETQQNEEKSLTLPPKITKEAFLETGSNKYKVLYLIRIILTLLISSVLISFAAHCLLEPNKFTIGGASGIAIMISYATNGKVTQSTMLFAINLPLIVLSFFFVKKKFAILTTTNILMQTMWLIFFERSGFPVIEFPDPGTRIFAAIAGGVCIGTAIALALKVGGSTGGADIIAVMIQKKISASSIAQMIFMVSAVIIASSFFVFREGDDLALNLLPIMLSLFEVYIESKTNDAITNGFQSAIEFRVITDKPDEMSIAVMTELSRGVTSIPATGMYTQEKRAMVICVVSRRQINAFKRIMKKVDPDAFAILSNVSQVVGLGFYQSEQ